MDIGIVSFAATSAAVGDEPPIGDADRMALLLDEAEAADRAGWTCSGSANIIATPISTVRHR